MPVSSTDWSSLATSADIITLGVHADELRRQRHGTKTTFLRVAEVPQDGPPVRVPAGAGEVRIVGVPPTRAAAVARAGEVVAAASGRPVSGFSLADLEAVAASEGVTLRALLEELRASGLELIGEAPVDLLHDARRAIEEVNIAGLTLARLTVDGSPQIDALALFKRVAQLQQDVAVIRAFAPLPRHANSAAPSTGYEDVRRIALARLIVDNVPSIQVDWARYGPKLAQVALTVGADDVDGVSAEDEASDGPRRTALAEIRRNILAAGFEPVERNGRFEGLVR